MKGSNQTVIHMETIHVLLIKRNVQCVFLTTSFPTPAFASFCLVLNDVFWSLLLHPSPVFSLRLLFFADAPAGQMSPSPPSRLGQNKPTHHRLGFGSQCLFLHSQDLLPQMEILLAITMPHRQFFFLFRLSVRLECFY